MVNAQVSELHLLHGLSSAPSAASAAASGGIFHLPVCGGSVQRGRGHGGREPERRRGHGGREPERGRGLGGREPKRVRQQEPGANHACLRGGVVVRLLREQSFVRLVRRVARERQLP